MPSSLSFDLRSRSGGGWRDGACRSGAVRRVAVDGGAFGAEGAGRRRLGGAAARWLAGSSGHKHSCGLDPGATGREASLTVRALAAELGERGTAMTHDTVWRFMRRENLTFIANLVAAEQDRPKVPQFRKQWKNHQHNMAPERLVSLDDAWIWTDMTHLHKA